VGACLLYDVTVECSLLLWRDDARVRLGAQGALVLALGAGQGRPLPQRNCGDRMLVDRWHRQPPILEDLSYEDDLARLGFQSMVRRAEVTRLAER